MRDILRRINILSFNMLFNIILLLFLAVKASEDSRPLTAMEVLKDAIVTYASSPLCTNNGGITVKDPTASRTHAKLSSLLLLSPDKNAYKKTNMIDFLQKFIESGYCKTLFSNPYYNAQSTFNQILDCSGITHDQVGSQMNRGWCIFLSLVIMVFKTYAPAGIKKLVEYDEAYNFLLFLLVHYKLNYGGEPASSSPNFHSIWKSPTTELLVPETTYLPVDYMVKHAKSTIIQSSVSNAEMTSLLAVMSPMPAVANTNFRGVAPVQMPMSALNKQTTPSPRKKQPRRYTKVPRAKEQNCATASVGGELYFLNRNDVLERRKSLQVTESQKLAPSSSQEEQHKTQRIVTEPNANSEVILDLPLDTLQQPIRDIPVPSSNILNFRQFSDQVNQEETHSNIPDDKEEFELSPHSSNSIYDDLPTEYNHDFSFWF